MLVHPAGGEDAIVAALEKDGRTPGQLVVALNPDLAAHLAPQAARSVLARLAKLAREGRARASGGLWMRAMRPNPFAIDRCAVALPAENAALRSCMAGGSTGSDSRHGTAINLESHMGKCLSFIGKTAVAACALATVAGAKASATERDHEIVVMQAGETPLEAIQRTGWRSLGESLRQSWLAAGHTDTSTAGLPALTSGTVIPGDVEIGNPLSHPAINFSFRTGTPGFGAAAFLFVSPNGQTSYTASFSPGAYSEHGSVSFASVPPLGLYSAPGPWTLSAAIVYDASGQSRVYDATQLAAIFANTSFSVINGGPVDAVPPQILSGRIKSDTVSLSAKFPLLQASIQASDSGTGLYLAYMFVQPPGANYSFAQIAPVPLPVKQASMKVNTHFSNGFPLGTWNITGYAVCDFALNCTSSMSAADVTALFGVNTFTVTQ